VKFLDEAIYERSRFQFAEDAGSVHWAEWIDLSRFRCGEEVLFPLDLLKHISESSAV
jgi:hypothetical protein